MKILLVLIVPLIYASAQAAEKKAKVEKAKVESISDQNKKSTASSAADTVSENDIIRWNKPLVDRDKKDQSMVQITLSGYTEPGYKLIVKRSGIRVIAGDINKHVASDENEISTVANYNGYFEIEFTIKAKMVIVPVAISDVKGDELNKYQLSINVPSIESEQLNSNREKIINITKTNYLGFVRGSLAGIMSEGSVMAITEGSAKIWFKDVKFKYKNYLSPWRLGLGLDIFQSINSIEGFGALSQYDFSLDYNLTPNKIVVGEFLTVGTAVTLVSHKNLFSNEVMIGLKAGWVTSLPKKIDQWLNKWSFFRKPKWVSAKGLYSISSVSSDFKVNQHYNISLSTNMVLGKNWQGQVGVGSKKIDVNNALKTKVLDLNIYYTTIGAIYQF